MKKVLFTMITLAGHLAFAGGYGLECSSADGSVVISNRGDVIKIHGKVYSSDVRLPGLEIWSPLGSEAAVEVVSAGKRAVLNYVVDNSCRDTTDLTFAQKVRIRDMKSKALLKEEFLICHNYSATTTGGNDCVE